MVLVEIIYLSGKKRYLEANDVFPIEEKQIFVKKENKYVVKKVIPLQIRERLLIKKLFEYIAVDLLFLVSLVSSDFKDFFPVYLNDSFIETKKRELLQDVNPDLLNQEIYQIKKLDNFCVRCHKLIQKDSVQHSVKDKYNLKFNICNKCFS